MTRKEFTEIIFEICSCYIAEDNLLANFSNEKALEVWYEALKDIDFKAAKAAVDKWILSSNKSPTIADIRKMGLFED